MNSVTHQAQTLALKSGCVFGANLALYQVFAFRADGRTDTTCEINDHLFELGLVGQKRFQAEGKSLVI